LPSEKLVSMYLQPQPEELSGDVAGVRLMGMGLGYFVGVS